MVEVEECMDQTLYALALSWTGGFPVYHSNQCYDDGAGEQELVTANDTDMVLVRILC